VKTAHVIKLTTQLNIRTVTISLQFTCADEHDRGFRCDCRTTDFYA